MNEGIAVIASKSRLGLLSSVGAVLITGALGACSAGTAATSAGATGATSSPISSSTSSGSTAKGSDTTEVTFKDAKGAVKALSGFTCSAKDSSWSATGKLTNSGKAPATYVVKVAIVKPKTFNVVGSAEQTVTLAVGKSQDLSFDKIYSGADHGLLCVPSVVSVKK